MLHVLPSRSKRAAAAAASAHKSRSALWAPKYTVTHPVDIAKKPTVAFGMQGRRFKMTEEDKLKEREGEHGGDLYEQIVWRATKAGKPTAGVLSAQRGVSPALDSWFEEVAYISSDGSLCA